MKNMQVMFSKKSDHWATPKNIYQDFINLGYYDPCPLYSNETDLNKIYNYKKFFINPPYSDIYSWVKFAYLQIQNGATDIVFLVPARTDTKWFHYALDLGFRVYFIKGRLKFNDQNTPAPFPSIYLIYNKSML